MLFGMRNTEINLMLNLNVNFNVVSQTVQDGDPRIIFCEYESTPD